MIPHRGRACSAAASTASHSRTTASATKTMTATAKRIFAICSALPRGGAKEGPIKRRVPARDRRGGEGREGMYAPCLAQRRAPVGARQKIADRPRQRGGVRRRNEHPRLIVPHDVQEPPRRG